MEQGDQLDNLFTREELEEKCDSFDASEIGSKPTEEEMNSSDEEENEETEEKPLQELDLEEEDFNVQTIEKVSLQVLTSRIQRVMVEVICRGEPAAMALFDVANKILFQSTMSTSIENNSVMASIIYGIKKVILNTRERDQAAEQSENIIMLFISRLSIKNKSMKCNDLLFRLIYLVDSLYLHADSSVRARVYRLIASLVEESNRYVDAMREHGDNLFLLTDEDIPKPEEMIPDSVKEKWMTKLAKSLLDKSPQVRCKVVIALSLWDHDTVFKTTDSGETTINDLLWKSIHDVDENVRIHAARRVHIIDEKDIDKCIDFVETSQDNKVRQVIVIRLASDVHLFSFSEKQRFRLINLLNNSDSVRVQDVLHQRLVEFWMKVAGEEILCPSLFSNPESDSLIPNQFPSIILEYLDAFVDPTAVYVFIKYATVRFINQNAGGNVEQHLKNLQEFSHDDSECVGLMRRTTFRLYTKDVDPYVEVKKTFLRILITRCFIDVVFELSKSRLDVSYLRSRALMFFLPDVTNFVKELDVFCSVYFSEDQKTEDIHKELLLYNIIHLINMAVKYGDAMDDRIVYKEALMHLLDDSKLAFSMDSITTMVTVCLDLCESNNEREEFCNWICDAAEKLIKSKDSNEQSSISEDTVERKSMKDEMDLRSATMLLSTCQHEEITKPTTSMTNLFKTIIPVLLGGENKILQKVGMELIGYATVIDFVDCEPYLKLASFLLQRDDEVLKSTGIHSLVRVIKSHGFSKTAITIFQNECDDPRICEETLAKLFEDSITVLQGVGLVQSVQDCVSMLSHGQYAWPKLLCRILLIVFQKSNEKFPLLKIFRSYCKTIRSDFRKINILQGFVKAIDVVSKTSEHDGAIWNITGMTELVCECLNSVHTVEDDEHIVVKKEEQKKIFLEIEFANRVISKSVSRPSAWFIRHVFTGMATSLRLECIPMEQLDRLHENLVDSYTAIRFNSGKTTQFAFKRFLAHCEKIISLQERMRGLKVNFDLKKVKTEDSDEVVSPASTSRKKACKNEWDEEEVEEPNDSDDSFEYFPKSTRTRKRANSSGDSTETSSKIPKQSIGEDNDIQEEEFNIEDSFEL